MRSVTAEIGRGLVVKVENISEKGTNEKKYPDLRDEAI